MFPVGRVLKPRGISGEIKAESFLDSPEMFSKIPRVSIGGEFREVERVRASGDFVLLKLAGTDSPDDAEALRGKEIFAERRALPEPREGRYYIAELEGCKVVLKSGEVVGEFREVMQSCGRNDVYVAEGGGRRVLFPYIEGIFESVDLEKRLIVLDDEKFREGAVYED